MAWNLACLDTRLAGRLLLIAVLTSLGSMVPRMSGAAYTPPDNVTPPDASSGSSGARSCSASQSDLQLTLLAPETHTAQTTSAHPTLVWFVPVTTPLSGELKLYERTGPGPTDFRAVLDEPYAFTSTPGFMSYTLSEANPGLQPHSTYVWQVVLHCGTRVSDNHTVRTGIERVEGMGRLPTVPAANPVARAQEFATAGFWYDAIALVAHLSIGEAVEARQAFIKALAEHEANAEKAAQTDRSEVPDLPLDLLDSPPSHSWALRQIAELE